MSVLFRLGLPIRNPTIFKADTLALWYAVTVLRPSDLKETKVSIRTKAIHYELPKKDVPNLTPTRQG